FQAEDGIRGYKVTGVQTCALPISFKEGLLQGRATIQANGNQRFVIPITVQVGRGTAFLGNLQPVQAIYAEPVMAIAAEPVVSAQIGRASCRESGWRPVGGVPVNAT